jgi:DNA-binding NarL/FixJ family response regulator
MSARPRLLIADREATRAGIRLALGESVEVCAEAGSYGQAIRAAKREQPDVCVVDAEIGGDGVAGVCGICRAAPQAAVVVLARGDDVDEMLAFVRAGATGYVSRSLDAHSLRRVIAAAATRQAVVPRSMVVGLLLELRNTGRGGLSAREAQVLGMIRRGHGTAQIADRLGIAPVTVRRHVSDLVRKLGVEGRAALVAAPQRETVARGAGG